MIYLNGAPLNITVFPDNCSQVWKLSKEDLEPNTVAKITWEYSNEGEFLQLAQLKYLLDFKLIPSTLEITYLPYGRQDKPVSNLSTFALVVFADLLNHLDFSKITINDPHSKTALNLIRNSEAKYPIYQYYKVFNELNPDVICFPDNGALNKYKNMYTMGFTDQIYGEKVRDQLTGNITSYKVIGDCKNKKVLICDDIADGGATFILLAKDLLAAGATEVNLFVTHGIFSKGLRVLFDAGIKRIFTQDGEKSARSETFHI